ncbi:thioredoxin domain-containing protein [Pigmentiphaga aceris]|uniref:Thioredoxin domain-containing protein n=1 Tax=Pigmentiphaga aceris TaxID=1940612 RepID=A0A5C0AZ32_9BURK|nr:thioredoxin domain-containing protein [Pigmentiphaga aceris]QEI06854.1 thioredoxin domain-containing protein [Pigmentiphaga aceris]
MRNLSVPVGPLDHSTGPANAPVTLVEYGDYACSHCGASYTTIKAVQLAMGKQLRFVFRNFPVTTQHPHGLRAAQLAEAASHVGQFWLAHDMLYAHQHALTDIDLMRYGSGVGVNALALREAFDRRFDRKIESDFMSGMHSGVNSTPAMFINGSRYDGPRDVDSLIAALSQVAQFVLARV